MKNSETKETIWSVAVIGAVMSAWALNVHYAHRQQQIQEVHPQVNWVRVVARHADGQVFLDRTNKNLRTNAGGDWQGSVMGTTGAQPAACNFIALTNTAISPATTDTTLAGEITGNGLSRAQGTFSATSHTQFTVSKTFTATGAQAAQAAGLFTALSGGTMCFENTFSPVSLVANDTLQVIWTVNY